MAHDICPVKRKIQELLAAPGCPDPKAKLVEVKAQERPSSGRPFVNVTQLRCPTTDIVTGSKAYVSRSKSLKEYHIHSSKESLMTPYLAEGLVGVLG